MRISKFFFKLFFLLILITGIFLFTKGLKQVDNDSVLIFSVGAGLIVFGTILSFWKNDHYLIKNQILVTIIKTIDILLLSIGTIIICFCLKSHKSNEEELILCGV
jgi:hypothetical protein